MTLTCLLGITNGETYVDTQYADVRIRDEQIERLDTEYEKVGKAVARQMQGPSLDVTFLLHSSLIK